ncbi:endonuclease G [Chryseobacterium sp. CBTAP 102]|uniref:DNA/RNA non-specific endonuclease n=1 Tax=Chryseobacterium sp. CBTAP 102 TaxID=2135644 RepID=UPI000D753A4D|nr:DNA/RNA non-specific endonuclease [Chryseobacterium sp. CBTAP 102]PXW17078.1 endonuclease G [Chryseobacterium sp. CBTAP 102]
MKLSNLKFIAETEKRFSKLSLPHAKAAIESPTWLSEKVIINERLDHLVSNRFEPFNLAKERILKKNDLMSINYLQLGFLASNPVCRIHVKNISGGSIGFGTGFLISPNLLLTNNHVFANEGDAQNSLAEFNFQYDQFGEPTVSHIFTFNVNKFFYTNERLDFTIVYVNPDSKSKIKPLYHFGFLKLTEDPNKALVSECVSIIQHPSGQYKQIAIRENQLIAKTEDFITYFTDTAPGSSGAPVYNDQWQVVALHHSGVPRKDEQGNYLCKDGTIFQENMDENLIDWIANEGVRISSILQDIKSNINSIRAKFPNNLVEEIFNNSNSISDLQILTEKKVHQSSSDNKKLNEMSNKITFNVPVEITLGIGLTDNLVSQNTTDSIPTNQDTKEQSFFIEKAKNPNYKGRNGYDANFVSSDNFKIEIEDLLKSQSKNLAPLLNPTETNKSLLHYFNFSIAIHKSRKLCMMTAVNIDGNRLDPIKRENTKWIIDPRMDEKYQTGPAVYADNDLDRGHMVRRLDPVWGPNAAAANDDTFHFSNSTPQHKDLNQKTWLSLENYILDSAGREDIKVSVFTGPVFSEDDIPYRGVLLPLQFWKVAVMIKADGTPSVSGYMLKQPENIEDFRNKEGIREDGFGQFKTYQVPLQKIADLTGIAFNDYNEFDPLNGVDFRETIKLIEITGKDDIKL